MKLIDDLENILISLKSIDEDNFETDFDSVKNRMIMAKNEILKLEEDGFLERYPKIKEKIEEITKLISEEYDNKINLWRSKLGEISEMLISSKNEKKILSYMR